MAGVVSLLRAPRFALAVIASLAVWCGAGAWAPWALPGAGPPPAWAVRSGLDHPFTTWPFLALVALLFASTLACTWGRRARIAAALRGELDASSLPLRRGAGDAEGFLRAQGLRGRGPVLRRFGLALWGGWVLHVGLLLLIAAVLVQQAFADGGAFDLAEGEAAHLSAPGVVFGRARGPLAPEGLPELEVRLQAFDPFVQQPGYAPDRLSRLELLEAGKAPRVETLDRAAGVRVGEIEVFQAIPAGLSLTLEVPGMGPRMVRLREVAPRRAEMDLADAAGRPARLAVETEREISDPLGTGRIRVWLEREGRRTPLEAGAPFDFGGVQAKATAASRWGRFTWTRTPGLGLVWGGFAAVLLGCLLLAFPGAVARLGEPGDEAAARLFAPRLGRMLVEEWERSAAPAGEGPRS